MDEARWWRAGYLGLASGAEAGRRRAVPGVASAGPVQGWGRVGGGRLLGLGLGGVGVPQTGHSGFDVGRGSVVAAAADVAPRLLAGQVGLLLQEVVDRLLDGLGVGLSVVTAPDLGEVDEARGVGRVGELARCGGLHLGPDEAGVGLGGGGPPGAPSFWPRW